jgi:AsmA protein
VGRAVSLSGVNIELDGNVGEGVLSFGGDRRQLLQGTLAAGTIDLTPYVATLHLLADNEWNRQPITLAGLTGVDVDLRLSAGRVSLGNVKLGRTAVATNLRSGDLTVAVGESQAFGGIAGGTFGLAQSEASTAFKAQMTFADMDLTQGLGELIGIRRLEGKGTLVINVDGTGVSVYELMQGLNGTASLTSTRGAILGINVEQLLRRLERNPLAVRGDFRSGKTPYDTLTADLKVTQGVASVEDMRVEAPGVRVALAGSASIAARDLDFKGAADLVSGRDAVPTFELPFVVTGPWDNPLVWPDTQALLGRAGAVAPLMDAVRARLRRNLAPAEAIEPR